MKYCFLFVSCILMTVAIHAQKSTIYGQIMESESRNPISNATILLNNQDTFCISDEKGNFSIDVDPGLYNIYFTHVSYEDFVEFEVRAYPSRPTKLDIELNPSSIALDEIRLVGNQKITESQRTNSIQRIDIDEIQRLPGATMDLSKVIKTLPGVVPKVSFGYNLIVRGGGSFENKFFLDGIEIPAITHFNVQGLSGGPNGLLNTDLIQRATFNSGAFPTHRSNALSSVFELEQKRGREDRLGGKITLGASEYGLHLEGPLSKHSSYIISGRKSYTEYLLKAFNVPVIPAFTDFQYNHHIKLGKKDEINLMALGSSDKYVLNKEGEATESLLYNIGYIPEGEQGIKVFGVRYRHFADNGSYSFIISQDRLSNSAVKYQNNTDNEDDLSLSFQSKDINSHFKIANKIFVGTGEINYGLNYDYSHFAMDQYSILATAPNGKDTLDYDSDFKFQQYGMYFSYHNQWRTDVHYFVGVRADGNNFASQMENPFTQFSPRMGIRYQQSEKLTLSLQTGLYYQLPPSILIAYQSENILVNQDALKYIRSAQISGGMNYQFSEFRNLSIDGFYKKYSQYPFLLRDSISFANANGEYVAVGNQAAESTSEGRAYGIEIAYSQKLMNHWFGNISTSYIISEFANGDQNYVSSSWDSRFFLNAIVGKELKNNWSLGLRWTYVGGSPYTPFDMANSSNREFWDANNRGILDYSQINSERLPAFHKMDFRIDKKWFLKKATILLFIDIQNLYNNKFQLLPYLTVERNANGDPVVDESAPNQYVTKIINSDTGRVLPTIGFSIEF